MLHDPPNPQRLTGTGFAPIPKENPLDPTTWTGHPRAREVALDYQNAIKLLAPLVELGSFKNIARIKHVRDSNGLNLKEAKKVVDFIIRPQLDDVDSGEVKALKKDIVFKKGVLLSHTTELEETRERVGDLKYQVSDLVHELKTASHQTDITTHWLSALRRMTNAGFGQTAQVKVIGKMVSEAIMALPIIDQTLTKTHKG